MEKDFLDIDELAKKIEERIRELEKKEGKNKEKVVDDKTSSKMADLDQIIAEIDKRIRELENESIDEIDVNLLMDKVNRKLSKSGKETEKDSLYDLDEITKAINETIKTLEEKRKSKKIQKAKYCDLARKKAHDLRKK